jgi:DNA-binding FrmR family transcriptional regulator
LVKINYYRALSELSKMVYSDMQYPKHIQNRIKRVEGQVSGVRKMIVSAEGEDRIMTQLQASISSLESLKTELIKQQMKESMVKDVKKSLGLSD